MASFNYRKYLIHLYGFSEEGLKLLPHVDELASTSGLQMPSIFQSLHLNHLLAHHYDDWLLGFQAKLHERSSIIESLARSSNDHRDSAALFLEDVRGIEQKVDAVVEALYQLQMEELREKVFGGAKIVVPPRRVG
ncbi:MAG: hypothetical protein Q9182_004336 [Xanthomendoza sp. 2 TL-2023]